MSSEINPVGRSEKPPADWNVLVTLAEPTYRVARKLLARWGSLRRTEYFNVAVMAVADPASFLREFGTAVEQSPGILNAMSHVVPFEHLFEFEDMASSRPRRARLPSPTCRASSASRSMCGCIGAD
jgi:hypothetical protein